MEISSGTLTALYLFDVSEVIDLARLRGTFGAAEEAPRTGAKAPVSAPLRYQVPPIVLDGAAAGVPPLDGFTARLKFFDYGVVSLALSRSFAGSWPDLASLAHHYIENPALEARAEAAVREVLGRCAPAVVRLRSTWLTEDYLVAAVHELEGRPSAADVIASFAAPITQLLRGESQPLSPEEQEEILRNRLSYFVRDVVVPTWNAAFVYDSEAGAAAALELFEFANSQLLEFRYYDGQLEAELSRIYPALQRITWWRNLFGGGAVRAANRLHSVYIDVNEITDRTENALKIVGDIYAARVLALVSARLGLGRWKASVEDKLDTLDDIYRFVVEQVSISRGQFLELTVVLILILELVLFFIGVMK